MPFAKWRHFITARGIDCGYPRAVLRLEQGLTILLFIKTPLTVFFYFSDFLNFFQINVELPL